MKLHHLALALLSLALMACGGTRKGEEGHNPTATGLEYAPDMYHSIPLEPYSQFATGEDYKDEYGRILYTPDGATAQRPVAGTIARGKIDWYYPLPNTPEGYAAAAAIENPYPQTAEVRAEGQRLFLLFCKQCHGELGKGDGPITQFQGGYEVVPAYDDDLHKDLTQGTIFHSITYGRNLMGGHASQLTPEERWKIARYIQVLQGQVSEASEAPAGSEAEQDAAAEAPAGQPAETTEEASN